MGEDCFQLALRRSLLVDPGRTHCPTRPRFWIQLKEIRKGCFFNQKVTPVLPYDVAKWLCETKNVPGVKKCEKQ